MARRDLRAVSRAQFERLVAEALDGIPEEFGRYLENVAIVIEDAPSRALLRAEGLDPTSDALYGLYEGTPLRQPAHLDAHCAPKLERSCPATGTSPCPAGSYRPSGPWGSSNKPSGTIPRHICVNAV
jgi:hypothetical protein